MAKFHGQSIQLEDPMMQSVLELATKAKSNHSGMTNISSRTG
jgi:hypothetical protein